MSIFVIKYYCKFLISPVSSVLSFGIIGSHFSQFFSSRESHLWLYSRGHLNVIFIHKIKRENWMFNGTMEVTETFGWVHIL